MATISCGQAGLVGKNTKLKRVEFTQKIEKFIDAPFALGNKSKGWDCLNTLDEFYRSIGKKFPEEFEGITKDNYAEAWRSGKGKKLLKRFLLGLGRSIDQNYAVEGDLFVFEGEKAVFPGIYLGRGHLLMVFDKGVRVVPLKVIKKGFYLLDVRRLQ